MEDGQSHIAVWDDCLCVVVTQPLGTGRARDLRQRRHHAKRDGPEALRADRLRPGEEPGVERRLPAKGQENRARNRVFAGRPGDRAGILNLRKVRIAGVGDYHRGTHAIGDFGSSRSPLQSFDFVGKTEPERISFLPVLLSVPTVSIGFTPFLTGTSTSSTFDLTGLRTEFDKHPECAMK